jgi:hypothetical protein
LRNTLPKILDKQERKILCLKKREKSKLKLKGKGIMLNTIKIINNKYRLKTPPVDIDIKYYIPQR